VQNIGHKAIAAHEQELIKYTLEKLCSIPGLTLIGTALGKGGVFSFVLEGIHPQDIAFVLDKEGVSIRTGHHCAEPLVNKFGHQSLARASLGLYTNFEDIDQLYNALLKAKTFF